MKIKSIKKITLDKPKQYYDVINANPYNNFLIKTNNSYIGSHNCFFDEISFIQNQDVEKQKEKAKNLVNTASARMQSRFMKGDVNPTILVLASSKRTEQSFMETYIENKKRNESKTVLIVDEPQWVIRTDKDSKEKFKVAIGNKFLNSEVLPLNVSEQDLKIYRDKGFQIIDVPMGYYENFIDDIDIALTDIAGISTSNTSRYISGPRIAAIKKPNLKNLFTKEIIEVGDDPKDTTQYWDYVNLDNFDKKLYGLPMYIHMDLSESGDKTGIAGVIVKGKKPHQEGIPDSKELYYSLVFNVSIKAPKGHSISFEKNRQFIYWLKDQGFSIRGISTDTFQSFDTGQMLKSKGYDYSAISVDKVGSDRICKPYMTFKSAIYEERLEMYENKLLTEELIGLERNNNGKIDHSPLGVNCFTGDTKIRLTDGRSLSIIDLKREFDSGKTNYVYSMNLVSHKIEPKKIENVFCSGHDARLIEVTLDNNEKIRCTPNHRFMLRNGAYCEAKDLLEGDSLMPLYTKYPSKGLSKYRLYYEPFEDKWHYEHRSFASDIYDERYLVHHIDCNPINNNPNNLIWMSKKQHQLTHALLETGASSPEAKQKRSKSITEWHKNNKDNLAYWLRFHPECLTEEEAYFKHLEIVQKNQDRKDNLKQKISNMNNLFNINYHNLDSADRRHYMRKYNNFLRGYNIFSDKKLKTDKKRIDMCSFFGIENYEDLSETTHRSLSAKYAHIMDPTYQQRVSKSVSENHRLGKYENAKKALQENNLKNKKLKRLFPEINLDEFFMLFGFRYESLPRNKKAPWVNRYRQKLFELKNHSVLSIRYLDETEDVYDLTILDNHNFALDAGVFVHNSKDSADAVCGALFNASQHAEEFAFEYGEDLDNTVSVNSSDLELTRQQVEIDMENIMKHIQDPVAKRKSVQIQPPDPFGIGISRPTTNFNPLYLYEGIIV